MQVFAINAAPVKLKMLFLGPGSRNGQVELWIPTDFTQYAA
jgi:hypothetical protein